MFNRRSFTLASAGALASGALSMQNVGAEAMTEGKFKVEKTPEEWRKLLTEKQYYVLREHGTERAGTSPLDKIYSKGVYKCAGCGAELFTSETKFDSRTGWPSFWKPIDGAIATSVDRKFLMVRTEVHCAVCGGHLGHVFTDGPPPTGQRYCMNGAAMIFVPADGSDIVIG